MPAKPLSAPRDGAMKIKNAIGSQVAINNDTRNQRFFVSFCPSTSSAIGFEERFSILITARTHPLPRGGTDRIQVRRHLAPHYSNPSQRSSRVKVCHAFHRHSAYHAE